jgi:inositol phosphorylceramide mannosyltransferase catalytic subunit
MRERIPKRIIQTSRSADLPLLARAATSSLRLLNPDFEYMFFDDAQVERFIDVEFPQYRSIFESFPVRIQRYDFFRYLAVYRFGGFYFDTDVLLASGLQDLLSFGCVFPFEHLSLNTFLREEYGMDWEVGNYAFGAVAGHPFLEAIISNCVLASQHPEWSEPMLRSIPRIFRRDYTVLVTTGPSLVSRTLAEYQGAADEVKVMFPEDVRDESSWFCFGNYGVHFQIGSWRSRDGLLRRVLYRRWESMMRRVLFAKSLKLGSKRSLEFKRSTKRHQGPARLSKVIS